MKKGDYPHISVMLKECLDFFEKRQLRTFFEGTLGAGGHAEAILKAHPEIECYIGCDQDPEALEIARKRLAPWKEKLLLVHANFSSLESILEQHSISSVDGFFLTWESPLCN